MSNFKVTNMTPEFLIKRQPLTEQEKIEESREKEEREKTLSEYNKKFLEQLDKGPEPDPEVLPKVARFNILVRPHDPPKKQGSIILADEYTEKSHYLNTCGRVVAIGPDCFPKGTTPACEVGDNVVWGRGRGVRMMYKGIPFIILVDDEILMTIPALNDIDSEYAAKR